MVIVERDALRSDELVGAVRALGAGLRLDCCGTQHICDRDLDPRRMHILQMLADGADTRSISESMYYSVLRGRPDEPPNVW